MEATCFYVGQDQIVFEVLFRLETGPESCFRVWGGVLSSVGFGVCFGRRAVQAVGQVLVEVSMAVGPVGSWRAPVLIKSVFIACL